MVEIWFEAHSTTQDNEAKVASGWNDVDLSERGLRESLELVERSRERNLDAIFTSDLQRAVKSGVPTAADLHIPLYPDIRLRECNYGDFTQKPSEEVASEKPKRISEPFPNGESYEQVAERMKEFLDWLLQRFDNKTVMLIGHRGTHYALDHWIDHKSLEQIVKEDFKWQPGWKYELK